MPAEFLKFASKSAVLGRPLLRQFPPSFMLDDPLRLPKRPPPLLVMRRSAAALLSENFLTRWCQDEFLSNGVRVLASDGHGAASFLPFRDSEGTFTCKVIRDNDPKLLATGLLATCTNHSTHLSLDENVQNVFHVLRYRRLASGVKAVSLVREHTGPKSRTKSDSRRDRLQITCRLLFDR
jgi:hypothetical protein